MTSRLTPVSWSELVRRLQDFGFQGPYRGGKHYFMLRDSFRLTLPNPHGQDISVALLKEVLDRAGIVREDWLARRRRR
jgi:predicted RNA binding protein YcfA (HicA-like mRNA interferase family)